MDSGSWRPLRCLGLTVVYFLTASPLLAQTPDALRSNAEMWPADIEVRFDARYDDSPESLHTLALLARALPPTLMELSETEDLRNLVWRRYSLEQENFPRTYALLREEIGRLNELPAEAQRVAPGPVLVPTLPPRPAPPDPATEYRRLPQVYTASIRADTFALMGKAPRIVNVVEEDWGYDSRRRGSARSLLRLTATSAELGRILKAHPEVKQYVTHQTGAMEIQYAGAALCDGGAPGHRVLSRVERDELELALTMANEETLLFILDSGWPENHAVTSQTALVELFDRLRAAANHALSGWNVSLSDPSLPVASSLEPPVHPHAQRVANSLVEFEDLDTEGERVRVIYVPLSRDQDATAFLQELLTLHFIWSAVERGTFGHEKLNDLPEPVAREFAEGELEAIRRRVERELRWIPADAGTDAAGLLASSKAVLDALFTLGHWAAGGDRVSAFFVNVSWTLVGPEVKAEWPGLPRGLLVTAVGNDEPVNVIRDGVDFARRGIADLRIVPVANADPSGLQCRSSKVVPATPLAVGFDGQSDFDCCTSYAAPRVAWVLAADATRGIGSPEDWHHRLSQRIGDSRGQGPGLFLDLLAFMRSGS